MSWKRGDPPVGPKPETPLTGDAYRYWQNDRAQSYRWYQYQPHPHQCTCDDANCNWCDFCGNGPEWPAHNV